jgi:hypothetical protein
MKNKVMKLAGVFALIFCLLTLQESLSQEPKQKARQTSTMQELQGEITWVKKDKIAIVYRTDETGKVDSEILLPVDKDVKLVHIKSTEQLSVGDVVSIQFEEATDETLEGPKTTRKVKAMIFVRFGAKKPIEATPQAPAQSQVLGSE